MAAVRRTFDPTPLEASSRTLAERMQFMASAVLIIFLVGWCLWFFPYDDLLDRSGTPLGADFSMFYVAGQTVLGGAADQLYDQAEQQRRLQVLFPEIDHQFALPYRYPPHVALLMAPLAALPYAASYFLYLGLSCLAGWLALRALASEVTLLRGGWRQPILWAALGWPVALETLIGGQASMFAALMLACCAVLLIRRQDVLAGAVLALAVYKPNLLLLFGIGAVLCRPRMLRGAVPVAVVAIGLCWATAGSSGLLDYLGLATRLAADAWDVETPVWKVHGIASWIGWMVPGPERLLVLLLGMLAVAGVAWRWRREDRDDPAATMMAIALLITINALANPYTPIYDLTLLGVGSVLTAECLALRYGRQLQNRLLAAQLLLATLFFGPHLSQVVARLTGAQLFPLVLLLIAAWQARMFVRVAGGTDNRATQLRAWVSDG